MEPVKPTTQSKDYGHKTLRECYAQGLLAYLTLDPSAPDYGELSANTPHPTPRERKEMAEKLRAAQTLPGPDRFGPFTD